MGGASSLYPFTVKSTSTELFEATLIKVIRFEFRLVVTVFPVTTST